MTPLTHTSFLGWANILCLWSVVRNPVGRGVAQPRFLSRATRMVAGVFVAAAGTPMSPTMTDVTFVQPERLPLATHVTSGATSAVIDGIPLKFAIRVTAWPVSCLTEEKSSTPEPTVFASAPLASSEPVLLSDVAESCQFPSVRTLVPGSNVHLPFLSFLTGRTGSRRLKTSIRR